MYLWELIWDHWMALGALAISLWFFAAAMIPTRGQRDDDATRRARAERAREYQRLRRMEIK